MGKLRAMLLVWTALTSVAAVQTHPDFSGVWAPAASPTSGPPSASAGGSAAALPPMDLTVVQTGDSIALSRTAFDRVTTMTYTFDGRENTNKTGAVTRVTKSRWDGATFVIEGRASQVTSQGYAAWTFKETMARDAQRRLVLTSEHTSSDGVVTRGTVYYSKK